MNFEGNTSLVLHSQVIKSYEIEINVLVVKDAQIRNDRRCTQTESDTGASMCTVVISIRNLFL